MSVIQVKIAEGRLAELDALAREGVSALSPVRVSAPELAVLVAAYRERDAIVARVGRIKAALREFSDEAAGA